VRLRTFANIPTEDIRRFWQPDSLLKNQAEPPLNFQLRSRTDNTGNRSTAHAQQKTTAGYSSVVIFLVSHDIWILSWIRKVIRAATSIKETDLALS
jgi:hypothetical protein